MYLNHTGAGQLSIKTKCSRSGCRVEVEVLSPHPLTGSLLVPYITSSSKPAVVGSASTETFMSS
jgi:hypothetical protein